MKCYIDLIKEAEKKIDKICNESIFNNVKYYDVYNKYKKLKCYERALDNSYRHNNIIVGMHITDSTPIQHRINKTVAYNS